MATRREFLSGTLAATAAASRAAARVSNEVQTVALNTHEWFGDKVEQFEFPPDWHVQRHDMNGHSTPALTKVELRDAVRNPAGSKRLSEIAAGKQTVAIAFDDLTVPTPAYAVVPHVIEELRSAGVKDDDILFVAAHGCRPQMNGIEAAKKLGLETVQHHPWINHSVWDGVKSLGSTGAGNPVSINSDFVSADVRITIGGLESILPGLSGMNSIRRWTQRTRGSGRRRDMIDAANRAGVDFSVEIVSGAERRPVKVVTGELDQADKLASTFAVGHFGTEPADTADVVVVNAYPGGAELRRVFGWCHRGLKEGGSIVVINQNPMGQQAWDYLDGTGLGGGRGYFQQRAARKPMFPQAGQVIFYSQYLQARELNRPDFPPEAQGMRRWGNVIQSLRKAHSGDSVRVAVYPYAGLQQPAAG